MAEPTQTTQITSNIPEWMKPYAMQLLGQAQKLTQEGYNPYTGQRIADFSPLQQQAFKDIAGMQVSDQIKQATGLAGLAGIRAQDLSKYDPAAAQQFYQGPQFSTMATGFERVSAPGATQYQMSPAQQVRAAELERLGMVAPREVYAPSLERFRMGAPERVGAERFGLGAMQEYMSPYMQGVVEQQKRAAVQDYRKQLPGIGASSARVGGRGGTREALLESEARRGLSERMGDIEAQGLQQAYQQAASQFGQDRAAQMQAALANQQAGMTAEQQNLAAALQTQGLSAQQAMQAALANQQMGYNVGAFNVGAEQQRQQLMAQQALEAQRLNQAAGLTTGQQNLQALINQSQFGAGQGFQAQQLNQAAALQAQQQAMQQMMAQNQFAQQNAQLAAQYGLSGQQLAEQSRQFGAGLGLQGLQQQLAAAGALGGLGMQQYQQQMGIGQAQLGAGGQMQALQQEMLNQQYQDFINKQQLPYKQMEFMSGILRGLPATGQSQTMYQQPPSMFSQIAGLGLMGMGGLFGGIGGGSGRGGGP